MDCDRGAKGRSARPTVKKSQSNGHPIIVIGGSAGAVEVMLEVSRGLPKNLNAAVLVALHTRPIADGQLAGLIERAGPLPASYPTDYELIEPGRIYVAPPDHHLIVKPGQLRVTRGPKENGFRPAIDPLFRTAARTYRERVIGVILSGGLDDGTHGLGLVKRFGGTAVVQDPKEAMVPDMLLSACRNVDVDFVVPRSEISTLLVRLVTHPPEAHRTSKGTTMDADDNLEPDVAEEGIDALSNGLYPGPPTPFRCPECGGALWELSEKPPFRFRCHVGHSFAGEGLAAGQQYDVEAAMWAAVRTLDENAALNRRMANRASSTDLAGLEHAYRERAKRAQEQANVIRNLLVRSKMDAVESKVGHERAEVESEG